MDAGSTASLHGAPHVPRPIFVVRTDEKDLLREQQGGILVGVEIGHVGRVVTSALQPSNEVDLVMQPSARAEEVSGAERPPKRAIERYLVAGPVPIDIRIERTASPFVVRLIRCEARLNQDRGILGIVPYHEDDVALLRRCRQREFDQINPADPVRRDGESIRDAPVALYQAGPRRVEHRRRGHRLDDARQRHRAQHQTTSQPVVPADPVDREVVRVRVDRPNEKVDGLALVDARSRPITLDFNSGVVGRVGAVYAIHRRGIRQLPKTSPRPGILRRNRVGCLKRESLKADAKGQGSQQPAPMCLRHGSTLQFFQSGSPGVDPRGRTVPVPSGGRERSSRAAATAAAVSRATSRRVSFASASADDFVALRPTFHARCEDGHWGKPRIRPCMAADPRVGKIL